MPVLLTKIEGKGNGIKTVIPNMSDVAKALSRPPGCKHLGPVTCSFEINGCRSDTTKYFGCELGATTILDERADRWIVNGAHDANRMRELLDGFIDKFVLCGECKNPETVLSITKNQEILRDCKACGATTMVDMRHKLTQYILKNPPKKTAKRKASDAPKKEKDTGSGENTTAGDEDDDEIAKRLLQEAAELPDAEKSTIAKEEWSADITTEPSRSVSPS
jgi:translation initiation factor 5